jgi:hypothetical protein
MNTLAFSFKPKVRKYEDEELPLLFGFRTLEYSAAREANEIRLSITVIVEDASRFARDLVA